MNDHEKIVDHEGRISKNEVCVKDVLENHIPHIYDAIKDIKALLIKLLIGVILASAGLVGNLIALLIRR